MPAPALSDELCREAIQALVDCGGNKSAAARLLRIANGTYEGRLRSADRQGHQIPEFEAAAPKSVEPRSPLPVSPREIRNAAFWQRRFQEAERARVDAEHVAEQLAGLRDTSVTIPDWLLDTRPQAKGRSVVGCLVSDVHMGEVIAAEEIQGVNAFDPDIARRRLKRYFEAACIVGSRWASDTQCEGALLALAGDLISGDIHEELIRTNALTSHEQVAAVVECVVAGIRMLADQFGRVHVVGVPGNHGRTTHKPTAKLYARLSYDIAAVAMVARFLEKDRRVSFSYGSATDQVVPILGRAVLVTHGDKIGTRGGMGFAGPNLPIVRGVKKVVEQQTTVTGSPPDLILMGHYHTTSNPGIVLANGSVPGYSEFGRDIRAAMEPPQQWLFLMHSKWGLRERAPIQLEDPRAPAKPRVTVPARMG